MPTINTTEDAIETLETIATRIQEESITSADKTNAHPALKQIRTELKSRNHPPEQTQHYTELETIINYLIDGAHEPDDAQTIRRCLNQLQYQGYL